MVWGKLFQLLVDKVGELDTPPPKKKKRKRAPEPEPEAEDDDEAGDADDEPDDEPDTRDKLKVRWLTDGENPFCIPVVDLAPFALSMRSTSKDPQMAANVMSYATDDGSELATQQPPDGSVVPCALRFRIDRVLVDGALFQPSAMEDKWAIYLRDNRILCVRSWTRRVQVSAAVTIEDSTAVIGPITGVFAEDESAALTIRQLEFLLRSHALGEMRPAPLPFEHGTDDLGEVTATMFGRWGRRALFASHDEPPPSTPVQPLRTESLMHIAVARGERSVVEKYIKQGIPLDILARDGLGLPHWALASADPGMLEWLLVQGAPVDVRSIEGATPLMNAVQDRNLAHIQMLLSHRADPNAVDIRGFTALHRAAEMGSVDIAKLLLAHDAAHDPKAQGQTPLALAKARRHIAMVEMLSLAAGPAPR